MLIHDNTKLNELIARWDSDEGKPYKGSLIDRAAFEANPDSLGCMCAQGQILHVVRGMTPQEIMAIENQELADEMVMQELGISRGHAILLRQVNDSVSGAPSIVLTKPEKVLGEHAGLVLAFFKYLDAMSHNDWAKYKAARDAAGDAARAAAWAAAWDAARAAAWAAAWDAAGDAARDAAGDAARAAAWAAAWAAAGDAAWAAAGDAARDAAWAAARDAARDAAGAANEIQGHKLLKERGRPLFFLTLLGFQTIEALIDWAAS